MMGALRTSPASPIGARRRFLKTWAALGVLAIACAALKPPPAPPAAAASPARAAPHLLYDRVSPFGRVLVLDEGPLRVMRFGGANGADQSAIVRGDPGAAPVEYVRYALLGLAYHGHPARVLMVGLGGGTFTTLVHRALPDVTIDV